MTEELLLLIIRGGFMLASAGVEWNKVKERVKGVPAEQIPSILDAMYAEATQALDKTIAAMPEDPT